MCAVDYDVADVYHEENRKSRKEHICSECQRIIKKGENYRYTFGVWEKQVSTFRTCSNCLVPQDWLREECGGFLLGALAEEIEEHAIEYRKMFLYRWLIGIRRKWKNKSHEKTNHVQSMEQTNQTNAGGRENIL